MTASLLSGKEFTERLNTITKARLADHYFGVSALAREMTKKLIFILTEPIYFFVKQLLKTPGNFTLQNTKKPLLQHKCKQLQHSLNILQHTCYVLHFVLA